MEVYLPALLGNKVGPSNQPTDRQTGGVIGKLNFKKKKDIPTTARLHSQIGGVIGKLNFKKKRRMYPPLPVSAAIKTSPPPRISGMASD